MTIKEEWERRCDEARREGYHFETFIRLAEYALLELMLIRDTLEEQNEILDDEPVMTPVLKSHPFHIPESHPFNVSLNEAAFS